MENTKVVPSRLFRDRMRSMMFIFDEEILDRVFYAILGGLFTQYMIFRISIKGTTAIEDELVARDRYIFDPERVRKYLGLEMLEDDFLEEFYEFFSV